MAKKIVEDLGFIGEEKQLLIIKLIMEDPVSFANLFGVIEQNAFTVPEYRCIVGMIKDYFKKYGALPTYSTMETMIRTKFAGDAIATEIHMAYIDKMKKMPMEERDFLVDTAANFFKQQRAVYYCNKTIETLAKNGYKDVTMETLINNISTVVSSKFEEDTTNPLDFLDDTMSEEREVLVPTGIEELDRIMYGGHPKGCFGIIQGNAGCGKTTIATILANNAAAAGFKTIQIFFEDKKTDIYRKHYAYMVPNLTINDFIHPVDPEFLKKKVMENPNYNRIHENLRLMKLDTGEKTIEEIEFEIRKLANSTGFIPDVVIIDYFDCIKLSSNEYRDRFDAETRLARKLENFAKRENVALWVMHQGNRLGETTSGAATVQGTYTKKQIAQTYITIFRTKEDMISNQATIEFGKNRSFPVHSDLKVYFDNGAMAIDSSDKIHFKDDLKWMDDEGPFSSSI